VPAAVVGCPSLTAEGKMPSGQPATRRRDQDATLEWTLSD